MRKLYLAIWVTIAANMLSAPIAHAEAPHERVARITIHPVATTQSSLQYKLLPELTDQTPGNAAPLYLMASKLGPDPKQASEALDRASDFLDGPADQLPRDKAGQLLAPFQTRLRLADLAAHREEARWDPPLREDGINALLPHLSDPRGMALLWSLQSRLQILDNDWAGATRTISDGFSLARQLNGQAVTIQGLVAAGIADETLERGIQDWISHGDSPNLYWSLSSLPQPFIDVHQIALWEKSMVYFTYPILRSTPDYSPDADSWRKFLAQVSEMVGSERRNAMPTQVRAALFAAMTYPRARAYLLSHGRTPAQVDAMSVDQTAGMFWAAQFREVNDQAWQAWELPFWEGRAELGRWRSQLDAEQQELHAFNPLMEFLPAMERARFQFARLDREIAMLRIVEAVRDYAARHDGNPPASLDEIKDLPVPIDPVRNQPFRYAVNGQTVTIEGPSYDEYPIHGERYELTIVK